jgi:hypothetical protein
LVVGGGVTAEEEDRRRWEVEAAAMWLLVASVTH